MIAVFRVDSSNKIGIGHLIRCINISEQIKKKVDKIYFITKSRHTFNFIKKNTNFESKIICKKKNNLKKKEINDANETIKVLSKINKKILLIVDNYSLSSKWESLVKPHCLKLVSIDDFKKKHHSDLLINYNNFKKNNDIQKLYGFDFSILNTQIKKSQNNKKDIVVSFGGSDREKLTTFVTKILKKLNLKSKIYIFLGNFNNQIDDLKKVISSSKNIKVIKFSKKYFYYLKKAKFIVCGGGTTCMETVLMGINSIVFNVSKNQNNQTKFLSKNKLINLIKYRNKNNLVKNKLIYLIKKLNNKNYKNFNLENQTLIDEYGVKRICEVLFPSNFSKVNAKKASAKDIKIYFKWYNDPLNRKFALKKNIINFKNHKKWFLKAIKNKNIKFFIFKIENLPIGQVRLDYKGNNILIDYYLDKVVRGRGWGKKILSYVINGVKLKKNKHFIGVVNKKNFSSIKTFKNLNFKETRLNKNNFKTFNL